MLPTGVVGAEREVARPMVGPGGHRNLRLHLRPHPHHPHLHPLRPTQELHGHTENLLGSWVNARVHKLKTLIFIFLHLFIFTHRLLGDDSASVIGLIEPESHVTVSMIGWNKPETT